MYEEVQEQLKQKARDERRLLVSPKTFRKRIRQGINLERAIINGTLIINKESDIRFLLEDIIVFGDLRIESLDEIVLPERMEIARSLMISDCKNLTHVSDTITVGEDVILTRCSSIKSLGNRKDIQGSLGIEGCASLEKLPDGLRVGKMLYMRGFPLSILSNVADPGCIWCNLSDLLDLNFEDIPMFLNASFEPEDSETFHEILAWRLKKGV